MLLGMRSTLLSSFSPASLFAAGEQGVWYDPSDLTTLFQDSAGTTPVTAVEQAVGLMFDKSKGTPTARRNRFTYTEDFAFPNWLTFGGGSVTGLNVAVAPDGTTTADSVRVTTSGTGSNIYQQFSVGEITTNTWTFSVYVKRNAASDQTFQLFANVRGATPYGFSGDLVATDAWQRFTFTHTETGGGGGSVFGIIGNTTGATANLLVWGAQLEAASSASAYQKITTGLNGEWTPGNHATQSTSAARPVLSARVNLLTRTQEFENAVWTKLGVTVTSNQGIAPDGTNTADLAVVNNGAQANVQLYQDMTALAASTSYTVSASVKKSGARYVVVGWLFSSGTFGAVSYDLDTQTVSRSAVANGFVIVSSSIVSEGNGWYRITVTATMPSTAGFSRFPCVFPRVTAWTSGNPDGPDTGNGTDGILVWGADLRVANDGVGLPVYQRVNTSTDYDTTGFPLYLRFDGTDDSMATGTITPGTDKVQAFSGVRKLSDSGTGTVLQLSSSTSSNDGTLGMYAPFNTGAAADYAFISKGTVRVTIDSSAFVGPETTVLTGIGSISGPTATLSRNTVQIATSSSSQGTGNYLAYALNVGTGAGLLNGRVYSLIARFGANLTAQQISDTETWVNARTKAY
jgi:hypothetical protein